MSGTVLLLLMGLGVAASLLVTAPVIKRGGSPGTHWQVRISLLAGLATLVATGAAVLLQSKPQLVGLPDGGNSVIACQPPSCATVDLVAADAEAARRLYSDKAPKPPGPWPFVVLFDDGLGLYVRSSPEMAGFTTGLAAHGAVLWVDCRVKSAFDPEPGDGLSPDWLRVRWPTSLRTQAPQTSLPTDASRGWAFGKYLAPSGHNGSVPRC